MFKKNIYILFLLPLFYWSAYAENYKVDGFSDQYYGYIDQNDDESGTITIKDKKSDKDLITLESESISIELHDGSIKANILQAPYGEQSVIMYEDYNFDGVKDFAISDGRKSCYGGLSFQVYLAKKGAFVFSESFTRLAQEYCGMFDIDPKKKTISTMTKSGCCWHEYSTFIVQDNKPKAIEIIEESCTGSYIVERTIAKWDGKRYKTTIERRAVLDNDDIKKLFSFSLLKNKNKKITLFSVDNLLNYIFTNKENIELNFPDKETDDQHFRYQYIEGGKEVSFSNGDTQYYIYQTLSHGQTNKVGVRVRVGDKNYDLEGDPSTVHGRLEDISISMGNVSG